MEKLKVMTVGINLVKSGSIQEKEKRETFLKDLASEYTNGNKMYYSSKTTVVLKPSSYKDRGIIINSGKEE